MKNNPSPHPRLFISHKHADSKIADTLRSFITTHSGGRVSVFQSSSPWADSPKAGRNLNRELREALWRTRVVILVYTTAEQDWSYCMWECGVASHPQSPDTTILLFQCAGTAPALFAEQVNVNARDLVDIQKFADQFLTRPDFIPGSQEPITQFTPHGHEVATAAAELYQKLQAVLPPEKEDPSSEWPTYPFLQLELGLAHVDRIQQMDAKVRVQDAPRLIQENCFVSGADKYCEQLFGMPTFPSGTTLKTLSERWREGQPESRSKWVESLCSQILAGVLWQFPPAPWEVMQSLSDNGWRAPVMNRVRKIPGQKCMQFDIYFYKFDIPPGEDSYSIEAPGTGTPTARKATPRRAKRKT